MRILYTVYEFDCGDMLEPLFSFTDVKDAIYTCSEFNNDPEISNSQNYQVIVQWESNE